MQRNQSRLLLPDEWRHHDHCCRRQQKRKQHLSQTIGHNRLLKDANPCTIIRGGLDTDLLSMTASSSMDQVEYLNNSTIVSADSRGRIGVHRLALGKAGKTYNLLDLPPLQDSFTPLKLFPLSDASSFAVGLPNGDYQIYSGQEGRWTTCPHGITKLTSSSSSTFYTGYQRSGPYRRYHRDFNWPLWNCSLDDFSNTAITAWSQITNWETKRYLTRPNIFQGLESTFANRASTVSYSSLHNGWAFWETGSTLYSAFIDPELDCFSIMDHRVKGPVVCFSKPQSNHDDITSCCFVSDHALATSHYELVSSSSDRARLHSVRVWDLRKWNETPVSRTTTTHYLPQFPRDSVACMESAKQWHVSQRDGDDEICVGPSQPPRPWNSHVCINKLLASRDRSTIMISLQSTDPYKSGATNLILYDYIRDSVIVQQTLPHDSVVAATPTLDHVVVAHTEAGARTKISILDTTLRSPQPCPSRKRSAGMDVPRSRTTTTSSNAGASSCAMVVVGHMSPCLEDNLGLRTRLTSLSWNAEGTSFAGGSVDGDLFVWGGL